MDKALLIYNPTAEKGYAAQKLPQIKSLLEAAGIEYDLVTTQGHGHAIELAKQAVSDGYSLVIAAGGDGTVNEVVNGLMLGEVNGNGRPALGVLPIGRGNDFAYGVGIPLELEEAVKVLAGGSGAPSTLAAFQAATTLTDATLPTASAWGSIRWWGSKLKDQAAEGSRLLLGSPGRTIFLYSKAPVYEVVLDNGTLHQPFLMISVMNGRRMGGTFYMAPNSNPSDDTFDLCLAGNVPQIKILPLAAKFLNGTQEGHPAVSMVRSKKISVRAIEGTIPAHADGETICTAGKALDIELIPASLDVVTSHNGAHA